MCGMNDAERRCSINSEKKGSTGGRRGSEGGSRGSEGESKG